MIPDFIRRYFSIPIRRHVGSFLIESGMSILNIKDPTIPPVKMDYVGGFDFKATGYEFLRYFTEFGGLKPDHSVLDVGSGIGRMAIPLSNYLKKGHYEGVEIVEKGVDWCQKNITPRHPNFTFRHANIHNKLYNKAGVIKASEYKFPFADESFDFIFLTSVFTHMLPEDVRHYIAEISRVLKKTGRVLSTWFILNDESRALMAKKPEVLQVTLPVPGHPDVFTCSLVSPEDATAYEQTYVEKVMKENGLSLPMPILWGEWSGREDFLSKQDVIICSKS